MKQNRREMYRDTIANEQPEQEATYLVNAVIECGLYSTTMAGITVVSWQEINAWQQSTGRHDKWLAITVRELSNQYVSEFIKAKDPAWPSPLLIHVEQQEIRKVVSQQFSNIFNKKYN